MSNDGGFQSLVAAVKDCLAIPQNELVFHSFFRIRCLQDAFEAARPEAVAELVEAAKAFVAQLRYVMDDPAYIRVWECANIHMGNYAGPQYTDELQSLRAALARLEAREVKP